MKFEETLAKRRHEQYFDLVDKVQNVLKRIEVWEYVFLIVIF